MKKKILAFVLSTTALATFPFTSNADNERTYKAYLMFSDSIWQWGNWQPGSVGATDADVSGDGTYTVSIEKGLLDSNGFDVTYNAAGGTMIMCVNVVGVYDDYSKNDTITASVVSILEDGEPVSFDSQKIISGNIDDDTNNFKIEIYSEYGDTKSNPPINPDDIYFSNSLQIKFKLDFPEPPVVEPTALSADDVSLSTAVLTYDGNAKKPVVTVKHNNVTLTEGTDYTVSYSNNIKAGTATATVTGKGNYTGTISKTYTISQASIAGKTATLSATSYTYDGTAKTPNVTITGLTSGTDYTVSYSNNIKAGTATATITGKGNYTGTINKTYTISPATIVGKTATLSATSYTYDGTAKTPNVTITGLTSGTDYTVSYSNNIKAGTATATITGKGNYTGTTSKTYTITKASIAGKTATLSATSYTYDGTAKTPNVTITGLTSGTDYTVSYSNNIKAGTATATVTGKGNYTGTISKTYTISPASITGKTATLSTTSYTYDGTAKTPSVTIAGLTSGTDYTVSYSNNIKAGTATATVTGKGNYTGTISKTYTISPASITGKTATLSATSYTYDGTAKTPSVTITGLTSGTDYTVSYSNNIKAGTASATITGKGNYTGTISKTYTISPASIAGKTATLSTTSYTYDGTAKNPSVTITGLTSGTDYTVSYSNNIKAGTATATVTGKGNYTGTLSKTYTISPASITGKTATLSATSYTYDGTAKTPNVTVTGLTGGTDYTVSYSNNIKAGTATATVTGKGNYTGTISKTYTISPASIVGKSATLSATSYTYDGTAKTPNVTIAGLTSGTDYTVSYSNNISVGTGVVTIAGVNNYSGTIKLNFTINASVSENDISNATITNITKQTYLDGEEVKPLISVVLNGKVLLSGRDYKVSYKDNVNVGTGTATIVGCGKYTGTVLRTFAIEKRTSTNVAKPRIIGRQNTRYAAVVVWIPNFSVNGYEVTYADNESFSGAKTQTVTGYGNNLKAIDNSKYDKVNGYDNTKKLYVKVRAYIIVNGEKKYSEYSDVKYINPYVK